MTDALLTSPGRPRRSRKKWIIAIVIALVVIAAVAFALSRKREKPIMVTTDKAVRRNITQVVTATGRIQPAELVKISPEVSGEIIELAVKEGQIVRRGELLLRIKPDSYRAQVESQEAALSSARSASVQQRAQLAKAESDYARARQLSEARLISETDRNTAQTNYEIARAALQSSLFEIKRAEGALRQIRESLAKTTIVSPADGAVTALTSRLGERVVGTSQFAGTEVMRIADLNNMQAQVNVNENDVVSVKVGDRARITVDAYPDREVLGIVREIASTASTNNAGTQEEVTNFLVKISIADPSVSLRPGMSTTADIETSTVRNAVAVPIQSVTVRSTETKLSPEELERQGARRAEQDQGDNRADVTNEVQEKQKERAQREQLQRVVYVRKGETVEQRTVITGIADPTHIEIRQGLQPGEEVVSGSYTAISRRLKDGAKVELEKEKE